ncbi:hypothetical protein NYA30BAC_01951 [Halomonas sp. NYA30]
MKEHGKLFNTAMVQAFLEARKNQTRRVIDAHNSLVDGSGISKKRWNEAGFDLANATIDNGPSPAGNPGPYLKATCAEGTTHRIYSRVQPGDRIYVKEGCADQHPLAIQEGRYSQPGCAGIPGPPPVKYQTIYRADGEPRQIWRCQTGHPYYTTKGPANSHDAEFPTVMSNYTRANGKGIHWMPSMFMPRWAARLVFDVVSVRLERLKDMSAEDVLAEGFEGDENGDAFLHFWNLWDSVNGKGSWDANPPVWIYDLQPVGIKPATMPSQGAPTTCTLPGGDHASD